MNCSPLPGPGEQLSALPGIPEYFTHVISDMETRKLPFIWTLQRNVDGYSLMLKLPAKSPKRRRRHLETASKDILSREKDINVKTSSRAAPEKEPTRVNTPRRKSPSCKQRDRNRRRRWKRKKKSLRPLKCESDSDGTAADSVHEAVQDILSLATDANSQLVAQAPSNFYSDHEIVQDSLSLADANFQLVADIIDTNTGNDPLSLEVKHRDLPAYPRVGHGPPPLRIWTRPGGICAQCARSDPDILLRECTGCNASDYCTRRCQVAHWESGHKEYCRGDAQKINRQIEHDLDFVDSGSELSDASL
jgi:hypothetical protein